VTLALDNIGKGRARKALNYMKHAAQKVKDLKKGAQTGYCATSLFVGTEIACVFDLEACEIACGFDTPDSDLPKKYSSLEKHHSGLTCMLRYEGASKAIKFLCWPPRRKDVVGREQGHVAEVSKTLQGSVSLSWQGPLNREEQQCQIDFELVVGDNAGGRRSNGFYDKYLTQFSRRIHVVHQLEARRGEQLHVRVMEDPHQLILKQVSSCFGVGV
jgi:hypothetical protein